MVELCRHDSTKLEKCGGRILDRQHQTTPLCKSLVDVNTSNYSIMAHTGRRCLIDDDRRTTVDFYYSLAGAPVFAWAPVSGLRKKKASRSFRLRDITPISRLQLTMALFVSFFFSLFFTHHRHMQSHCHASSQLTLADKQTTKASNHPENDEGGRHPTTLPVVPGLGAQHLGLAAGLEPGHLGLEALALPDVVEHGGDDDALALGDPDELAQRLGPHVRVREGADAHDDVVPAVLDVERLVEVRRLQRLVRPGLPGHGQHPRAQVPPVDVLGPEPRELDARQPRPAPGVQEPELRADGGCAQGLGHQACDGRWADVVLGRVTEVRVIGGRPGIVHVLRLSGVLEDVGAGEVGVVGGVGGDGHVEWVKR
ncbi:hypothetical protein FJTKL_11948 [Diaporthe vaccinii]|uniref:Uncharacterized protein n=1 Tax=Diaporthe vaccinii TaxID=105482 RepID=A0ABR4FAM1_9PEZI